MEKVKGKKRMRSTVRNLSFTQQLIYERRKNRLVVKQKLNSIFIRKIVERKTPNIYRLDWALFNIYMLYVNGFIARLSKEFGKQSRNKKKRNTEQYTAYSFRKV